MADFAVSTAFTGIDQISVIFKRMGKNSTLFGDRTSRAFRKASRPASRFGDIIKGILGANLIRIGFAQIQRGLFEVGQQFVSLDDAMVAAGAKFKDVNVLTAIGRDRMKELTSAAREAGATTEFTATQAGQGLDFLALAGFNSAQAMASLGLTIDLATIASVDLARATDIASDALGAFGLLTEDTEQLERNFTRQNDVMALTMSRTNTNLEDMFESIKKGAPVFTLTGQSIETFSALVGIMASDGVKGAESGTALRNMMLRLSDATPKAKRALKTLGIQIADDAGNFRDIVDIFADLEIGLEGIGKVKQTALLARIFGKRGITGAGILLKKGTKNVREFRDELINAGGAAQTMAEIMRSSLGNQLKALQSAALETGFKIFDAFADDGRAGIVQFTQALRDMDVAPIVAILKQLINTGKELYNAFRPVFQQLFPIGIIAAKGLAAALKFITPILPSLIAAFAAYKIVLMAVAAWQAIVVATNPVLLIATGLALLAAGIAFVAVNWDTFVEIFRAGAIIISGIFTKIWTEIKARFFNLIGFIAKGLAFVGDLIGFDTSGLENFANENIISLQAPNKAEIESRQTATFSGELNINGAPPGSTVETKSNNSANVDIALAGVNP